MKPYWVAMDTETTGFEPETNSLVEMAAVSQFGAFQHTLVKPTTPIGFGAMATHHITNEMVENAPNVDEAFEVLQLASKNLEDARARNVELIPVFHNAAFDMQFMPEYFQALRYVCTWRCAVSMFPNAESHSNGALWYEFGLDHPMPDEAGSMPHRALFDAIMTADLMDYMLGHIRQNHPNITDPLEHMIWLTKQPILLNTVRFGKHRGMLWSEVPIDYLAWCLRQDMDDDIKFTCKFWTEEHRRG